MKRYKLLIALLILSCLLFGCRDAEKDPQDHATFYYCRSEYQYGSDESVVVAEKRDVSGHADDVNYILTLYLLGPMDETLISPLPGTTRLLSLENDKQVLTITLSDTDKELSDAQFTLACGCLTKTCLELTDSTAVTIISGDRSITMDAGDLLLFDDGLPAETNTEETQ